jgi:hypothetical protein
VAALTRADVAAMADLDMVFLRGCGASCASTVDGLLAKICS